VPVIIKLWRTNHADIFNLVHLHGGLGRGINRTITVLTIITLTGAWAKAQRPYPCLYQKPGCPYIFILKIECLGLTAEALNPEDKLIEPDMHFRVSGDRCRTGISMRHIVPWRYRMDICGGFTIPYRTLSIYPCFVPDKIKGCIPVHQKGV
jgi:hypothetical protein